MNQPFGDLLRQTIARKHGLNLTRLAHLAGYDQAILTRMSQGKKDLTGPSGRERVLRIISVLRDEAVLSTQAEANALLKAGGMPPLYDGQPAEAALLRVLKAAPASQTQSTPHLRTNLPAQMSSFIGREREMAEVIRLIHPHPSPPPSEGEGATRLPHPHPEPAVAPPTGEGATRLPHPHPDPAVAPPTGEGATRLLTLTGSGGCGKTRLAIEVGATASAQRAPTAEFADGVRLVEFASLAEGRFVADTVAAAFGLQAMSRTPAEVLIEHLHDKQLLLILDNCEHLIHDAAALAVQLLQACPQLHLLVTSREPLNIPGEVTWRVPPMALQEATQLFKERARAARTDFAITPDNAGHVAHICRRLDQMPLAIELAAARVRAFSAGQIAERLDDAFRLLTGGSRVALPRQQTLRAAIDWSYDLLDEDERALLRELSVFSGGWTLEAAEAIHGPGAAEILDQLVSKSLVVAEERGGAFPGGMRFTLLETIRTYAGEKLMAAGEDVQRQARQRHLDYFARLEETARPHLSASGAERKQWLNALVPEVDNLRIAMDLVAQHRDWQLGQRLFSFVADVWCEPGCTTPGFVTEASKWLDALIFSNPAASDAARMAAMFIMANVQGGSGDMDGYVQWLRKASALAHRLEDEDMLLELDARLGASTPDHTEAAEMLNRVLQHAQAEGRKRDEIHAISGLGERLSLQGQYRQALNLLEQGIEMVRQLKIDKAQPRAESALLGHLLWRLGQAYLACDDYSQAREALEENIALLHASGYNDKEPFVDLGTVAVYTGDYITARNLIPECFADFYHRDNIERVAQTLVLAAGLAHALGQLDQSARILGAVAAIRRDHHTHGVFERELFAEYDRRLPAVRAAMEADAFQRAWDAGQALTLKEAMAMALAL